MHDIIIVGGGPAGMTAAIYAARYRLDTIVISGDIGGQIAKSHKICNFPSYPDIDGMTLSQNMYKHVQSLDVPFIFDFVTGIEKKEDAFTVTTQSGKSYEGKKVIFTGGTEHRHLDVPGEKEFSGKGVSYCATCDAAFFKDKKVAVIGGGDAAAKAALLLSEYAIDVYIIYRREKFFRAEPAWIDLIEKTMNIHTMFNEEIMAIEGDAFVNSITLKNAGKKLPVDGVFVEIGSVPKLEFIENLCLEKEGAYLKTNNMQETNIKGFFAAGDVTSAPLRQIITAAAQGSVAAFAAYTELTRESP
ncbi:MAG: NAD(P)/FAD-dependent oxidoreductase [Nanoarchaeota archaeon]